MYNSKKIVVLIPAAGNSSRMGRPKQLLFWKESTLLGNCISRAKTLNIKAIVIVTGAYKEQIEREIEAFKIDSIHNSNWQEGLGSSIATGVSYIVEKYGEVEGTLILLPDQPFVTTGYLKTMIKQFYNHGSLILATNYGEKSNGVPVLFPKKYFEELKKLPKDNGAKAILKKHENSVVSLVPEFKLNDIDTAEDYISLK